MKDQVYVDRREDGIAFLVINKPQKKNAISGPMMDLLTNALIELNEDDSVRVIILKGEGDNFSTGGDLTQGGPEGSTVDQSRKLLKRYMRTIQTVQHIGKPVIAMVDGWAVGGAMSLALACDIIFVSDRVKFTSNFLKVGIIPEMGAMMFMPQLMGPHRAKELWFTGRVVGADEAYQMGFANRILPAAQLEEGTLDFAKEVATVSAMSLQITKSITNSTMGPMLDLVMEAESTASPFCTQTAEFKEIIAKFSKK